MESCASRSDTGKKCIVDATAEISEEKLHDAAALEIDNSDDWETCESASVSETDGGDVKLCTWDPPRDREKQLERKTSNERSPSRAHMDDDDDILIHTDEEGKCAGDLDVSRRLVIEDADDQTPRKGRSYRNTPGGKGKQKKQRASGVTSTPRTKSRRRKAELSLRSSIQKVAMGSHSADDQREGSSSDDALFVDENADTVEPIHIDRSIDKTIEENAIKNNLTANNVKSILRSLITHELVQTMLRNSLALSADQEGAVFEPKLTRSKMKQVLQKGNDTKLWPVSPAKLGRPSAVGPSILDVSFTEDEDEDDEYQPDKEVEDLESDEESVTSSQVSDIGSPLSSTPRTPLTPTCSVTSSSTPLNRDAELLASPMGPPLPPRVRPGSKLAQQFRNSMKVLEESKEDQDVIAGRTRSKLPLTTTSLYDIEEAFVAPDITADMYDTYCDDTDWQDFLKGLHKYSGGDVQNESMECGDDEQNDPEFNYLSEAETEELDEEDFRFDKPFRIPRKELNELMEELDELFNEDDEYSIIGLRANMTAVQLQHHQSPQKKKNTSSEDEGSSDQSWQIHVSDDHKRQIEEHLRKHIQLTCQMYVLAQGSVDYKDVALECRKMIIELGVFRSVSVAGTESVYNVCNWMPAVELVKCNIDWDTELRERMEKQGQSQGSPGTSCSTASWETSPRGSTELQEIGETKAISSVATDSANSQEQGETHASQAMSSQKMTQSAAGQMLTQGSQNQENPANAQPSMSASVNGGQETASSTIISSTTPADDRKRSLRSYMMKLLDVQKRAMWDSPVFLYPALLPTVGLLAHSVPQPRHFTHGEDRLIAMGLDQFGHLKKPEVYIQRLMIPCKTAKQIKTHIKNMTAQRGVRLNNPIKYYRQHGKLRPVPRIVEQFSPSMIKPPRDQPDVLLPMWCKHFREQLQREENMQWAAEQQEKLRKRQAERDSRHRKRRKHQISDSATTGSSEEWEDGENSDVSMETLETLRMKLKPRVKRRKIAMRKHRLRRSVANATGAYSSTPVTVLPSASGMSPNAIVTSSGIYVPLHLASPTRMNSALASGAPKPHRPATTRILTTHQLLGIAGGMMAQGLVGEEDVSAALPGELRRLVVKQEDGETGSMVVSPKLDSKAWHVDQQHTQSFGAVKHAADSDKHEGGVGSGTEDTAIDVDARCQEEQSVTVALNNKFPANTPAGFSQTAATGVGQDIIVSVRASDQQKEATVKCADSGSSDYEAQGDRSNSPVLKVTVSVSHQQPSTVATTALAGHITRVGSTEPTLVTCPADTSPHAAHKVQSPGGSQEMGSCMLSLADTSITKSERGGCEGTVTPLDILQLAISGILDSPAKDGARSTPHIPNKHSPTDAATDLSRTEPMFTIGSPSTIFIHTASEGTQPTVKDTKGTSVTASSQSEKRILAVSQFCSNPRSTVTETPRIALSQESTQCNTVCQSLETLGVFDSAVSSVPSYSVCSQVPCKTKSTVPHAAWSSLSSVCAMSDVEVVFPVIPDNDNDDNTGNSTPGLEMRNCTPGVTSVDPTPVVHMGDSAQRQETSWVQADQDTSAPETRESSQCSGLVVGVKESSPSVTPQPAHCNVCVAVELGGKEWLQSQNKQSPTASTVRPAPAENHTTQVSDVAKSPVEDAVTQCQGVKLIVAVLPVPDNPPKLPVFFQSVQQTTAATPSTLLHTKAVSPSTSPVLVPSLSPTRVMSVSLLGVSPPDTPTTPPRPTQQQLLETTPIKSLSPSSSLHPIAPKAGPLTPSPQIYVVKRGSQGRMSSPKKQQLQRQVRAILPKGYVYEMKITSPTKAAARSLKRRATLLCQRASPNKPILPLTAEAAQNFTRPVTRGLSTSLTNQTTSLKVRWTRRGAHLAGKRKAKPSEQQTTEMTTSPDTPAEEAGGRECAQEESDETASEVEEGGVLSQEDSQTEEDGDAGEDEDGYMSELMAASTTIGFNPHKKFTPEKDSQRAKQTLNRERKLAVLAPDVIDSDDRKDERDTAYAQAYLNKVKVTMARDPDTYSRFMELLAQFENEDVSPVQVYGDVCQLLQSADYPELLEDFAGFLSPGQALRCGCHPAHQQADRARVLLRKLEMHYERFQPRYLRVLRSLARWDSKAGDTHALHQSLLPLLRSLPTYLLDEVSTFFPDQPPPQSHLQDFEELSLGESNGDEVASPDEFEEVELAEESDPYRTKRCPCLCHADPSWPKRLRGAAHCTKCSLRVHNGKLYFQPAKESSRRPAYVTFHKPVLMSPPPADRPPATPSCNCHHRTATVTINTDDTQDEEEEDDDDDDDDELEEDGEEKASVDLDSDIDVKEEIDDEEDVTMRENSDEHHTGEVQEQAREEGEIQGRVEAHSGEMGGQIVQAWTQLPVPAQQPGGNVIQRPWNPMHMSRMRNRVLRMKPGRAQCGVGVSCAGQPTTPVVMSLPQQRPLDLPTPTNLPGLHSDPTPCLGLVTTVGRAGALSSSGGSVTGGQQLHPSTNAHVWTMAGPTMASDGGTVAYPGPDNTVIMYNPTLSSRTHNQPNRHGAPDHPSISSASDRPVDSGGSVVDTGAQHRTPLPTLPSPGKNIRQGNFAGLLSQRPAKLPNRMFLLGGGMAIVDPQTAGHGDGDSVEGKSGAQSPSPSQTSESPAVLSHTGLLDLYGEEVGESNIAAMLGQGDASNTSPDLLAKAMRFALIQQSSPDKSQPLGPMCDSPEKDSTCHGHAVSMIRSLAAQPDSAAWSREADRLILDKCREYGPSSNTFMQVAGYLSGRTPQQVAKRFSVLMTKVTRTQTRDGNTVKINDICQ